MLKLVLITVLNSPNAPMMEVSINPSDIKALRKSGSYCFITHKDIDVEVKTEESCEEIKARISALKPASKSKGSKKNADWF